MVFGTTYCAVSHLPIEDGDKCMILPLGFCMRSNFTEFNKASINNFLYLYYFDDEPQEAIYNGNPDDIEFLNKDYPRRTNHQLYMIVHFDFYKDIIEKHSKRFASLLKIDNIENFDTIRGVYEKAQEIRADRKKKVLIKLNDPEYAKERASLCEQLTSGGDAPKWMSDMYFFARFMDSMGIIPYPSTGVDQHETGKLFEEVRVKYLKTQTQNKQDESVFT